MCLRKERGGEGGGEVGEVKFSICCLPAPESDDKADNECKCNLLNTEAISR